MTRLPSRTLCLCLATAVAASACSTGPKSGASGGYTQNCVQGAVVGGLLVAVVEAYQGRKTGRPANANNIAKGAAAGCAVGLAATAIGKIMDAQQQARHEEAMQREARRRALEQQSYAQTTQRNQPTPTMTPEQRAARSASLDRARADYEAGFAQPVVVDLGKGGTSTIQAEPPRPASAPDAANATPAGCQDYSVLVNTAAGRAKQFETWCPDAQGQMVRSEARQVPVG